MENWLDRFTRKIRPALLVLGALCFPVFLFSYGKMIAGAFEGWQTWQWAVAMAAHAFTWVAMACWRDHQSERQPPAARRDLRR